MARWCWMLAALLLVLIPFIAAQSETEGDEATDVGTLFDSDDTTVDPLESLGPAPDVETIYLFPNSPQRMFPAGESAQILVGINNNGKSAIKVNGIRAALHLPFDHKLLVQNLTSVEFSDANVPPGVQGTFAYAFDVNKYFQPGPLALVSSVLYEIDGDAYKTVFYNGTIEVVEASGFFSGETLFLVTLGLGLLGLLGMWLHGQLQRFSKTRRTKVVETGTRSPDSIANEWLQGTAFMRKPKDKTKTKKKK